jgi:hypothetical protein
VIGPAAPELEVVVALAFGLVFRGELQDPLRIGPPRATPRGCGRPCAADATRPAAPAATG